MSETVKNPMPTASAAQIAVKPVKFIHRKDGHVPTYQADGAWGAANQFGLIRVSFYTESPPIPTSVIQPVHPDGRPKGEPQLIGADDPDHFLVVRDFQCDVVLTLASAAQISQMLANFVNLVQQQMKEQAESMLRQKDITHIQTSTLK